jgi:hypothetical protein
MSLPTDPPPPPRSPEEVRLDDTHPSVSDEEGRRADGVNYLAHLLDLTPDQAEELYAIVEERGIGLARLQIWNAAKDAAIAGGYLHKLCYDLYARQFVDLYKAHFWNDPSRLRASAIGKTRI